MANSKAPRFFFLCQLISHAIMRYAEMSPGPTDYRPRGAAEAGQNMTSPSTNEMKGQKHSYVGDSLPGDTQP